MKIITNAIAFLKEINMSDIVKNKLNHKSSYVLSGVVLGIVWFGVIWGYEYLNITNVDWMKNGDSGTHFFGWMLFKQSEWRFPLGLSNRLTYPYDLSITYTDSIPLFAVIFKLFSPLLPDVFQYFGIWGLMCLILQGVLMSLIVYYFKGSFVQNIAISSMAILQPCMIGRMFTHTALAGQWIILLAIYIWLDKKEFLEYKKRIIAWSVTIVLASLIHLYFVPMVVVIMVGNMIENISDIRDVMKELCLMVISCASGLFALFCMGAMSDEVIIGGGLGYYCLNLNTLFNSAGWSKILPGLPYAVDGQYEGIGYLGLGVIVLVLFTIVLLVKNFRTLVSKETDIKRIIASLFIVLALIILGLGTLVSFNDTILFTWKYPQIIEKIVGIFRSSGRMIWPVCYLIIIGTMVVLAKHKNKRVVTIICVICLTIQIWDLSNSIYGIHVSDRSFYRKLSSDFWNEAVEEGYDRFVFAEPVFRTLRFADFAIYNHMQLTDFHASRKNNDGIAQYRESVAENLKQGKSNANELYIYNNYPKIDDKLYIYSADSYFIAAEREIDGYMELSDFESLDLNNIDDFYLYLERLKGMENCVIIICVNDEASDKLGENVVQKMNELGLMDLRGHFRESYIAIIDEKQVIYEELSSDVLKKEVEIAGESWSITSAGGEARKEQAVLYNGEECSVQSRGLNIVVYDKTEKRIIDSVCFDTYEDSSSKRLN